MDKPVRLMTQAERDEVARRFDNLHVRPHTDDWAWYDRMMAIGEIQTQPTDGKVPHNTRSS